MTIPLDILYFIFLGLVCLVVSAWLAAGLNRAFTISKRRREEALRARCRGLLLILARQTGEPGARVLAEIEDILTPETAEYVAVSLPRLEAHLRSELTKLFQETGLVHHFVRQLKSQRKWKRARAAKILGELSLPAASAALYRALDDPDPDIRSLAARGLSKVRHPRAQAALIDILGRHEELVSSRIAAMFIDVGTPSVPLLVKNMRNTNWRARFWTAEILGQVADRRAEGVLVSALSDSSADVRAAAAKALGRIGSKSAGLEVIPLLKDPAWFVRSHAAWTLGQLEMVEAIEELVAALCDRAWWVRKSSLEALANIGEAALPALMAGLEVDDRFARESAAEALQRLGVEVPSRGTEGNRGRR
ncbi:MAG: HEAT repeat domain-containing protein [Candidatus Eisenbacteria bacterium]|nr:HEAT repeat domain-containing protein [Candidatus Eisenbacteria bacterium]